MPEDTLTLLFSHIDPLYELHASFLKDIEQRMATFFGVNTRVGNYDHRDIYLIRDVVLSFSLFSSFLIILTALVQ